jgi:hypothetical protein
MCIRIYVAVAGRESVDDDPTMAAHAMDPFDTE